MIFLPLALFAQSEQGMEKVSLRLQWKHQFEFAGFYAAVEKGYYAEADLDVDIREYELGTDVIESVLSEEATFGTFYSTAIKARMEGKPIMLMASYFQRSPLALVTKPDIYFPRDLIGKTVMGEKHQFESTNFGLMFRQSNMTTNDFIVVPHTFGIDQFISGEVDAMSVFLTNELFHLRQNKVPFNIIDPNNYGVPLYDVVLFTSESFAKNNPETMQAFIDASNRGWEYALKHPEEIVDLILAKYNSQSKTKEHLLYEADKTKRMVQPELYPIGWIDPVKVKQIAEMFVTEGVAEKNVSPETYIFGAESEDALKLTSQEKIFIDNNPTIRAVKPFHQPPFIVLQDGNVSGYLPDLLAEVAGIAGFDIQYIDRWTTHNEMMDAVRVGEADLLPNLSLSQDAGEIARTVSVVTTPNVVVSKISARKITNTADLFGKRVAVVKGFTQDAQLNNYPKIKKVHVAHNDDGFTAVRNGEADYFLNNLANAAYVLQETFATDLRISGELPYDDFPPLQLSFGLNSDNPELAVIISKALAALPLETRARLQKKWLSEEQFSAQTGKYFLDFTDAERAYMREKKQIKICIDPKWEPYELIDEQGNYVGLTADYFDVFQQMIPIPIRLVRTETWAQSIQYAKARECDILSMLEDSPERDKYLNFTEPYVRAKVVLVAQKDVLYIDGLENLSEKTLAIVKSYIYEEIVRTSYPDINIITVDSVDDALQTVADGKAYAAIGTLLVVLPKIQGLGLTNLKVAGPANFQNNYRIGARNDEPQLVSIFDKAIRSIDQETENEILRRWYTVSVEESFDYSLIWKLGGLALFMLSMVLYWNRRLSVIANKLNEAKEEAETANKAKSRFLANMSHELRTPLNAILGFSQLMFRDVDTTKNQRKNLKSIMQSGEYLLELLNDVLELSKIEAGKLEANLEHFDLYQLFQRLEAMIRLSSSKKALALEFLISPDIPTYVETDRSKLSQILINLLSNAVKFTTTGKVTLEVRLKESEGNRFADTSTEQPVIHFCVTDTGIGIPQREQGKIFDSFFQQENNKFEETGTGLGLSISRRFVELLGGELCVESIPSQGSQFYFEIPLKPVHSADQERYFALRQVIGIEPGQKVSHILVAEDNTSNREFLVSLLCSVGFKVKAAHNGKEALELWKSWKPDVLCLDLRMPDMDGMLVMKKIRENPQGHNTKIIALTAHAFEEDRQKVLDGGGDDFLRKPIAEAELLRILQKHTGVEFQYRELKNQTDNCEENDPHPDTINEASERLPEALRTRFLQSLNLGDIDEINTVISEIKEINAPLGAVFQNSADEFAYEEIVAYFSDDAVPRRSGETS